MKKKLDNRGFAITTIIFGTLILFMLLLVSLLAILALYRNNLNKLVDDENSIHGGRYITTIKANRNYATFNDLLHETDSSKKTSGLYCFTGNNCRYVARSELYPNENGLEDNHEFTFSGGSNDETGDCEPFTAKYGGYYYVELCGAEGGSAVDRNGKVVAIGGKGACTSGYINLSAGDVLYACVGGAGKTTDFKKQVTVAGGFNGGGQASNWTSMSVGSGGGATDIRLVNGKWNDASSLNSRIMVAAGGGGALNYGSHIRAGGGGGDIHGVNGLPYNSGYAGKGGTQLSGGTGSANGSFGQGASGGGGGGGGYYGGGSGSMPYGSGAGGSSFISGYAGTNAVTSLSNRNPSNNTVHYSGKYFVKASIVSASHSGNGSAKIQFYGVNPPEKMHTDLNKIRYIRDCISGSNARSQEVYSGVYYFGSYNLWTEIQAISSDSGANVAKGKSITGTSAAASGSPYSYVVDGNIYNAYLKSYCSSGNLCSYSFPYNGVSQLGGQQCITVDLGNQYDLEEISIWHYYKSDIINGSIGSLTYNDNISYISSDGSTWETIVDKSKAENYFGRRTSAYSNIDVDKYVDIGKYTGDMEFTYNGVTTKLQNTNIQVKQSMLGSDWKIKLTSSGTLTLYDDYDVDVFIVGGGGNSGSCTWFCSGDSYLRTMAGGGGFHSTFTVAIESNNSYDITVGGARQDTIAFGKTAKKGGNGGCWSDPYSCKGAAYDGASGKACGEFETSGNTYSGNSGGGANTGKPGQAGTVIIRPKK